VNTAPYSQHFIFIITNKWPQNVRVLHNTRLERLTKDEYSSLLDPFVSYAENTAKYSQHLIFIVTYKWAQQARVFHYTRLQKLTMYEHSSLLYPIVSYCHQVRWQRQFSMMALAVLETFVKGGRNSIPLHTTI
jgi:hypothetical protein